MLFLLKKLHKATMKGYPKWAICCFKAFLEFLHSFLFPKHIFSHANMTLISLNYILETNIKQINKEQIKYTNEQLHRGTHQNVWPRLLVGTGEVRVWSGYREGEVCLRVSDRMLK